MVEYVLNHEGGGLRRARAIPTRRAEYERVRPKEPSTLAPDIAFQHAANVAAAAYAKPPPYIVYRVATHVSAPSLRKERDIVRAVSVRTRDDVAVVQDLPRGANQLAHGFPVTPNFDALSTFTLTWRVGLHMETSSYVHDVAPLVYPDKPSTTDVVVVRLRQYHVDYAADSSAEPGGKTHVTLAPYDFVKREVVRPDSTFFLSDVYIDNATGLPSEIRYSGGNDISFVLDYAVLDGHWLVDHAHYEETLHGPLRLGSLRVIADAVYDRFEFPAQAPDARLGSPAPEPAATASPS